MRKLKIVLAAVAAFFIAAATAFAAEPGGVVNIPWGEMVSWILPGAGVVLFGGILMIAKAIAPPIYGILRTAQVEQLLANAIAFGVNAVDGAVKGKTLDVPVGNEVLRWALVYAMVHGGEWLNDFAGDSVELAQKIYARFDLPADASAPNFVRIADEAHGLIAAQESLKAT